ncbi:c-type cytochrome [Ramlibacter sp. PS4R-6]|uniref:c-type cytochrome n=1 Tax=Ramlibacter sp. PS4R-6 TaxID=3133438 RepID=UPI00309792CB
MKGLAFFGALLALAACDTPVDPAKLRADDAQVVAQGRAIYAARCASCHGEKLEGQPNWQLRNAAGRLPAPPHDAKGHTWHHPDEVLFNLTKHGIAKAAGTTGYDSDMPAFAGVLSDLEINAVLSFIKAQWPERIRRAQEEVDAAHRRGK